MCSAQPTQYALLYCFCLLAAAQATAQTTPEKKVDYLERIYFSGKNKAELNVGILVALQEMQGKQPSDALAKQATYLLDIQDEANNASDACELLDLLAVGIYNIDAAEASKQGVRPASDKARKKTVDALASINKLGSSSNTLSNSARSLEWSSYLLSGGRYGAFAQGAGKIANKAGQAGAVLGAAGAAGQTVKEVGGVLESVGVNPFKKKDKACGDVLPKEIEIGQRPDLVASAPPTTPEQAAKTALAVTGIKTVISLQGVSNATLKTVAEALRAKEGITSVEKTYSDALSTITVQHTGATDALADWLEEKFNASFKLKNYDTSTINLIAKSEK